MICTDKTGTLTQNRMEVRTIYVPDRFVAVADATSAVFAAAHRRFLECARHCHDLKMASNHRQNGLAIRWSLRLSGSLLAAAAAVSIVDEIPFGAERKRLVTVHRGPNEVVLFVKGAPEELLPRTRWIDRDGQQEPLTADARRS